MHTLQEVQARLAEADAEKLRLDDITDILRVLTSMLAPTLTVNTVLSEQGTDIPSPVGSYVCYTVPPSGFDPLGNV